MRLFTEHTVRSCQSLDGAWKFVTDPEGNGLSRGYAMALPEDAETVLVPSVWNTKLGLLEYEGVAWYSRRFTFEGGTLRLVFEGVLTEATVYLDGEEVGGHYGGFTQFDVIVRDVAEGTHSLTVRVSNLFDEHSIPQAMVDWYHYGGITRSVSAEQLSGVSILGNRMHYELSSDLTRATVRFELSLCNATDSPIADLLRITLADSVLLCPVSLEAHE